MENSGRVCRIKAKRYSYLVNDGDKNQKAKGTKKCVMKRELQFQGYINIF